MSVGLDESGRGCLYGPVFAAAVYLRDIERVPQPPCNIKTWDSKRISANKRINLAKYIYEFADSVSIKMIDVGTIDDKNILQSTILAMHGALDDIKENITQIYVDGDHFKDYERDGQLIPFLCIPHGDAQNHLIGMASIIAKVSRDAYIEAQCKLTPRLLQYQIDKNKGYGTKAHITAIAKYGPIEGHRRTFNKVKEYLI